MEAIRQERGALRRCCHRLFHGLGVALLLRGTYSPYGDGWNSQFEIPVVFQSGVPSPVFVKGVAAGLAFEYTALEDPNAATSADRFGKIVVQDEVVV